MLNKNTITKKQKDKKKILESIKNAAIFYKKNLVGNIFMYVFDGRYIEVSFKKENFKHLTGVTSNLTPLKFYNSAVKRKLTEKDISYSSEHPYELVKQKIMHLNNIDQVINSVCFIQEDVITNTCTFKFSPTNMYYSLMLGEDHDFNNIKRSDYYIPKSLRHKDCFNKSNKIHIITHIFVKKNNEEKYNKILYCNNDNIDIPFTVRKLLNDELLNI